MANYCLWAAQLTDRVWLLQRGPEEEAFDLEAAAVLLSSSQLLMDQVLDMMDTTAMSVRTREVLKLPDWGVALAHGDLRQARSLKGGHLILTDRNAEDRLGFAALDAFSRLGVSSMTYITGFRDDSVAQIAFNAAGPCWRRLLSLLVLFHRRQATITNRRLAAALRPVAFGVGQDGRCETPVIERLEASVDDKGEPEQFSRYMVFEGSRQLAPVRNTHDDIGRRLDGRYSLWNRKLVFAPTDMSRLFKRPYWIVENDESNQKWLPYYPKRGLGGGRSPNIGTTEGGDLGVVFPKDASLVAQPLRIGDVVVVATHALPPGGAERQWAYLALGLKRAGYDVRFVVYRKLVGVDAHYSHMLDEAGIPIIDLDSVRPRPFSVFAIDDSVLWKVFRAKIVDDIPNLWRIVELLRQLKPKAVYVQLDEPNIYLCLAALIAEVPHVIPSFRNINPSHFAYHRPWYRDAYRFLVRSARVRLSGNSRLANQDYADWLGLEADQIACIPNALDDELFPRPTEEASVALRRELNITPDHKVILGVFRFAEEKNPLCFLRTVERVAKEIQPLRVLIVGVGRLAAMIAQEVEARALSGIVTVLGHRTDVNVLMSIADLLLLTSHHEGLPNVVLEAQLSGLPVVATNVGGTSEALRAGESGILCRADDDRALAAASIAILTDQASANRMAEAGAAFIHGKFGLAAMADRYLALAQGAERTHTNLR